MRDKLGTVCVSTEHQFYSEASHEEDEQGGNLVSAMLACCEIAYYTAACAGCLRTGGGGAPRSAVTASAPYIASYYRPMCPRW